MSREYTQKQIDKYQRQKYISTINKCTKNLYKLFKSENSLYTDYKTKFIALKKELEKYNNIRLDTEHLKITKKYLDNLYKNTIINSLDHNEFIDLKNSELSMLNRLQKAKNRVKYSKDKHREKFS